ncbi:MAG: phenylalanine--tRNA ligase subunit beta [Parcubacteria group bacterium]|nr:phenylalanine--tRNA ligase subunit beta [Parcubacteria group bacterium]
MNILLSYQWLKEHVATKKSPRELAKLLSLHSMSVEKVLPEAELLTEKIVLGEILEVNKHPNADKLKLALVSTGKEQHHIVCGAPNIKPGMKVAFALLGAMVKWHGEGDAVELKPATIRGVESQGMICDDSEIGLAKKLNLAGVTDYSHLKAPLGTPLSVALKLDDTVLDIEITTNRIDAASVSGMAREVAAMTGEKLQHVASGKIPKVKKALPLSVTIEAKGLCLGFHAIVLDGVKVGPSPEWLKRRLLAAGHSSFNNVVDITNYVMREVGHPLHAFDYGKIKDGHLVIRTAKPGEKIKTLDGKDCTLEANMIVVADKVQAQAIAGVMGGEAGKVTEGTTAILLEAASWNSASVRKTMKKLDTFSDAGAYFSRNVSPQQAPVALARAIELICEVTGAQVASPFVSKGMKAYKPAKVSLDLARAEQFIGEKLKAATVKKQLEALGFEVKAKKNAFVCAVPHWRQYDVAIEEDLIEEVARLYGYHNVKNALPSGQLPAPEFNAQLEYEDRLKTTMKGVGFTEVYTYSLVSAGLLKLSGRHVDQAIKLLNPLDNEHAFMRTRLLPSLVEIAAMNQGSVAEQHLFELANAYIPQGVNKLPDEKPEMAGLLIGDDLEETFRQAKGVVLHILGELGLAKQLQWTVCQEAAYKASESLSVSLDGKVFGQVGVFSRAMSQALGLKKQAVVFELDIAELIKRVHTAIAYQPLPKFPSIDMDLSVTVKNEIVWGRVEEIARLAGAPLVREVELFDIYDHGDGRKSFGFHLEYRSDDKTLEMKDVEPVQAKIVDRLGKELLATLRS